jgi:hypothetical protein
MTLLWFGLAYLPSFGLLLVVTAMVYRLWERSRHLNQWWALIAGFVVSLLGGIILANGIVFLAFAELERRSSRSVQIVSAEQITRVTTMQFPLSVTVVDGEIVRGVRNYLIAEVEIPFSSVDDYIQMQRRPFKWGVIAKGDQAEHAIDGSGEVSSAFELMRHRGWRLRHLGMLLYARAESAPRPSDICWIIVDKGSDGVAHVYVYWEGT